MNTTVVIVQPALFPWVGVFEKFVRADVWIHLDHVAFQKAGYLHRFRLRGRHDVPRWTTVPIGPQHHNTPIDSVELPQAGAWRRRHRDALIARHRRSPFLEDALGLLDDSYTGLHPSACELAVHSFDLTIQRLELPVRRVVSSRALNVQTTKSRMVADLASCVGASTYLFGPGRRGMSSHYLDRSLLHRRGIATEVMVWAPRPYRPDSPDGLERLSVLDAIAWRGYAGARDLILPHG